MDMKTQIQEQAHKLIEDSSFFEKSPRHAKFLLEVCKLLDEYGRIPNAVLIAKHLKISKRSVNYYREILQANEAWPFPKNSYRMHLATVYPVPEFDTTKSDAQYKEDMERVAAARRAKYANNGQTLKNEDIEAHL